MTNELQENRLLSRSQYLEGTTEEVILHNHDISMAEYRETGMIGCKTPMCELHALRLSRAIAETKAGKRDGKKLTDEAARKIGKLLKQAYAEGHIHTPERISELRRQYPEEQAPE